MKKAMIKCVVVETRETVIYEIGIQMAVLKVPEIPTARRLTTCEIATAGPVGAARAVTGRDRSL